MNTEMRYSVRQLASMAGISPRTLHYYDEIGLLEPSRNPQNGYRVYTSPEVMRLQQIMFLRELGLSLDRIGELLDRPGFDLLEALQDHRQALQARQQRLGELIETVERTIHFLQGDIQMEGQELFSGFSEEQQKEYELEVERRWGDEKLKVSQGRWASYSEEKKQQIMEEGGAIYRDIIAAMPQGASSQAVQECIRRWHQHLRYFYEPDNDILLGLADLYNVDPEFNANFRKMHPDLAEFMRQAIQIYCAS